MIGTTMDPVLQGLEESAAACSGYAQFRCCADPSLYLHATQNGFVYGVWALPRPMTKTWGSGKTWAKICSAFGRPDVAFGKTDGIPEEVRAIDRKNGFEWAILPFADDAFEFGYWDPPYDHLYKPECKEIWRVCKRLAILHTHIYPTSWMLGARRVAGVFITMGPLKAARSLQIFVKDHKVEDLFSRHNKVI